MITSIKVQKSYKDIHSLLGVAKEKVGNLLLNMCSTLQSDNYNVYLENVSWVDMLILIGAPK